MQEWPTAQEVQVSILNFLVGWSVGSPHHFSIYQANSITLKAEAGCSSKTLMFTYNHGVKTH
jgi:hypothetical protein